MKTEEKVKCPYEKKCGGCKYQGIPYEKQLKEKDLTLQKLQQEMLQLRPRIDELQAFLNNSKDTLQGWLKENKKGWEENIGKLCDESILWQRGLFPQSTCLLYTSPSPRD
mgnify:CR=1 FL=1